MAKVAPAYEAKVRHECDKFRQFSIMPSFRGSFERVIYNQLLKFIKEKNVIHFAFQPKKSCVDILTKLNEFMREAIDKRNTDFALYIDFKKRLT